MNACRRKKKNTFRIAESGIPGILYARQGISSHLRRKEKEDEQRELGIVKPQEGLLKFNEVAQLDRGILNLSNEKSRDGHYRLRPS